LLLLSVACAASPAAQPPIENHTAAKTFDLTIQFERTGCYGTCPSYTVAIDTLGRVKWHGAQYVTTVGDAVGHVDPTRLEALDKAIDVAQFFTLDSRGNPPCKNHGRCATVICTDTPHSRLAITRGNKTNAIDFDHCGGRPELERLFDLIDQVAGTKRWIGTQRY